MPVGTVDLMSKTSATRFEFARPMPAPKPMERIQSLAVDVPSLSAHSTSLMPGPWSFAITVAFCESRMNVIEPPSEWMQMLISSSYAATATRRMSRFSTPAAASMRLISFAALPALERSLRTTTNWRIE